MNFFSKAEAVPRKASHLERSGTVPIAVILNSVSSQSTATVVINYLYHYYGFVEMVGVNLDGM